MLTNKECFLVLERALKEKGDFAELFFEDTEETQIVQRSGVVQGVKGVRTYGVGLYLLDRTDSIYVYTNEVTLDALLALADCACELMEDKKRSAPVQLVCPQRQNSDVFSAVAQHQADHAAKIRRMIEADHAIRSGGDAADGVGVRRRGYAEGLSVCRHPLRCPVCTVPSGCILGNGISDRGRRREQR